VPLTAAEVQVHQPVHRREQLEKRRGIHQVPVEINPARDNSVHAAALAFPLPPDIWPRHSAMLACPSAMDTANIRSCMRPELCEVAVVTLGRTFPARPHATSPPR